MKKIVLFFAMLSTIAAFSQQKTVRVLANNYTLSSSDTTFYMPVGGTSNWVLQFNWSGIDPDSTTVTTSVRVTTYNKTHWLDYSGLTTYTINSASGDYSFEDNMLNFDYIGIRVQRTGKIAGKLYAKITLTPNK